MARAISGEIDLTPMPETGMNTLYFGGGTPSLLKPLELELIFAHLRVKPISVRFKKLLSNVILKISHTNP